MKWSGRNINRFLRLAIGPKATVEMLEGYDRGYRYTAELRIESEFYTGPFDHAECWGRDGRPLVLVGHPYDLRRDRADLLRRLQALGAELFISPDAGWYGFGTYHVRLSVPGILPPPTDAERFSTELALEG